MPLYLWTQHLPGPFECGAKLGVWSPGFQSYGWLSPLPAHAGSPALPCNGSQGPGRGCASPASEGKPSSESPILGPPAAALLARRAEPLLTLTTLSKGPSIFHV